MSLGLEAYAVDGTIYFRNPQDFLFTGNLMPQDQSARRRGAPADHVLVATADVGRSRLDDDAVVDSLSRRCLQFGVIDALHLDFARPEINHSVIGSHEA